MTRNVPMIKVNLDALTTVQQHKDRCVTILKNYSNITYQDLSTQKAVDKYGKRTFFMIDRQGNDQTITNFYGKKANELVDRAKTARATNKAKRDEAINQVASEQDLADKEEQAVLAMQEQVTAGC